MSKINVRSPYFIFFKDINLTSAKLEIRIYEGAAKQLGKEVHNIL